MTPLERAARALDRHVISANGIALTKADKQAISKTMDMAMSVLLAVRAPSESMIDFGSEADENGSRQNAAAIWTAMIDAILEQG